MKQACGVRLNMGAAHGRGHAGLKACAAAAARSGVSGWGDASFSRRHCRVSLARSITWTFVTYPMPVSLVLGPDRVREQKSAVRCGAHRFRSGSPPRGRETRRCLMCRGRKKNRHHSPGVCRRLGDISFGDMQVRHAAPFDVSPNTRRPMGDDPRRGSRAFQYPACIQQKTLSAGRRRCGSGCAARRLEGTSSSVSRTSWASFKTRKSLPSGACPCSFPEGRAIFPATSLA